METGRLVRYFRIGVSTAPMRKLLRRVLPARVRRPLGLALREAPHRIRDFLPDLSDALRPSQGRLQVPPARLRFRVSGTSSRREFLEVGRSAAADVLRGFEAARRSGRGYARWLDFGCGSGRISRHLIESPAVEELHGTDVDVEAIRWASRNLPAGRYSVNRSEPPLEFPPEHFDVVVAGSVFTHLDENPQRAWLAELLRTLRPGGLLIACTHSPNLTFMRPDLTEGQHAALKRQGFLFAAGGGRFNEDGAFHSRLYLESEWGKLFRQRLFEEYGYCRFQDLSVWEKPAVTSG